MGSEQANRHLDAFVAMHLESGNGKSSKNTEKKDEIVVRICREWITRVSGDDGGGGKESFQHWARWYYRD